MAWEVAVYDFAASISQMSLNAVTGNATGTVVDMTQGRYSVTLAVTATGTLTGTVTLRGSIDGTNWFLLSTAVVVAGAGTSAASSGGIAFRFARADFTGAVGSGTITAKIMGIN